MRLSKMSQANKSSGSAAKDIAATTIPHQTGVSRISASRRCDAPPVLIDTDAGLDDAGAIFMVLKAHKEGLLNVTAITTTHGNTTLDNVNKNVLRLLDAVDLLDIPVYSGANSPLVQPYLKHVDPFHGFDGFGNTNLPHPSLVKYINKTPAALKIVQEVQCNAGYLNILAIGPLTNIALAKKIEPNLLHQLGSLHIMGGNTTGEGNFSTCGEFNFLCDPEAAQIVLSQDTVPKTNVDLAHQIVSEGEKSRSYSNTSEEQKPCFVYITPWETCLKGVNLPYSYRRELGEAHTAEAKLLNLGEAEILAKKNFCQWITCDQLAAAWMMDMLLGDAMMEEDEKVFYSPIATKIVDCRTTVELQGSHTRGQMVLDWRNIVKYSLPVKIVTEVNEDLYRRYLRLSFGRTF